MFLDIDNSQHILRTYYVQGALGRKIFIWSLVDERSGVLTVDGPGSNPPLPLVLCVTWSTRLCALLSLSTKWG